MIEPECFEPSDEDVAEFGDAVLEAAYAAWTNANSR